MTLPRGPVAIAALLGALVVGLVLAILIIDPALADVLTREDGVVEWLQAFLFAAAGLMALGTAWRVARAGGTAVGEVLLAALLTGLIIGEIDLDRIVFGRKLIHTRFLVDDEVWLGWRVLAAAVMVGVPAALGLYALRHRAALLAAGRRALGEPSGRVLLAGLAVFAVTEALERPLGRIPGLPRYVFEELLELVAAIWLCVGLWVRAREPVRGPGGEER
jgi:hypothetical protein